MLDQLFFEVYTKFKLHFYQEVLTRFQSREASLTTVETFCMESIQALGSPTINEFASFLHISPSNAAYKVNSLVKKGYVNRIQSPEDRREFHLRATQKYIDYYNISTSYVKEVVARMDRRFSAEDRAKLTEMLSIVSEELMPEVELPESPGSVE
ncbi:MarR family winged helix-turn-helix transcriptional regulator [Oscillibacter ruminantium]|uniref:MarR family winged helix-turn-helix transcriptional regulator n=1 Tax=Oscillibacter ruminantium TaxID=1263547 RepID=UPI000313EBAE|nr:MarR family transcriptional regulator [Oscillibacter ruminantium]MDN0032899.1 MarR family transcriptional regulator [Oscillibacter valericigenes]MEA5042700.1 MarR family transcriptional regulator [Oscillibacter ruminantium]